MVLFSQIGLMGFATHFLFHTRHTLSVSLCHLALFVGAEEAEPILYGHPADTEVPSLWRSSK